MWPELVVVCKWGKTAPLVAMTPQRAGRVGNRKGVFCCNFNMFLTDLIANVTQDKTLLNWFLLRSRPYVLCSILRENFLVAGAFTISMHFCYDGVNFTSYHLIQAQQLKKCCLYQLLIFHQIHIVRLTYLASDSCQISTNTHTHTLFITILSPLRISCTSASLSPSPALADFIVRVVAICFLPSQASVASLILLMCLSCQSLCQSFSISSLEATLQGLYLPAVVSSSV